MAPGEATLISPELLQALNGFIAVVGEFATTVSVSLCSRHNITTAMYPRAMSVCFHPYLFDGERFAEAAGEAEDHEGQAMALVDCFVDEDILSQSLGADASEVFPGRYHPESGDYLGGVADAVRAGVPKRSKAARLLKHASCLEGRFAEIQPAFGYLSPREVSELAGELRKVSFRVRGLEADRVLLLRLLDLARERKRGLAFMAV